MNIFTWLDNNRQTKKGKLINQLIPLFICTILYIFFIISSKFFINDIINASSAVEQKILLNYYIGDIIIGFFLYFVTAIDYALVVGRMQIANPGSKARVIMNIATVMGCYVGVTIVLFLYGFAKDMTWLIVPILIFAGSVMIKLAFEGTEYFEKSKVIPKFLTKATILFVDILHFLSRIFTFWMPEIARPKTKAMSNWDLAKWSFILPFIVGLDDLIGYMGAMEITNVFGLLIGIYLADVLIDILIFTSPSFTKKLVESDLLAFIATFAFLYLAYKSYSESIHLIQEKLHVSGAMIFIEILIFILLVIGADIFIAKRQNRKAYVTRIIGHRS